MKCASNSTTTACPPMVNGSNHLPDNVTVEDLEALEPHLQTFLVCLYSLTAFFAFFGNLTVIIVEIYGKRSALNLRKFLINLAISDILLSIFCVPFSYTHFMLGRCIFPHLLCPLVQFAQLLSVCLDHIFHAHRHQS